MNIAPVLMCGRCRAPTLHIFVERRPQARKPGELAYVDCIYDCDRCGELRAWGNEPREETAYGRRLAATDLMHAVDKHGMRRERCRTCRGADSECPECDDEGEVWVFDSAEPCAQDCPIERIKPPEYE